MESCRGALNCINCNASFQKMRPQITETLASAHFERDYPGFDPALITGCDKRLSKDMHKFEKNIGGNLVFRALIRHTHVLYAIDERRRLILLRAFRKFSDYKRYLEDERLILETIKETASP